MSDLQIVKVTVTARRKGKLENVKLIQKWQLREAIIRKKKIFLKSLHKMVTPLSPCYEVFYEVPFFQFFSEKR